MVVVSIGPNIDFIVQSRKVWPSTGSLAVPRSVVGLVGLHFGISM